MAKLNLTDAERQGVKVTFNVNKFEAHLESGALLGKYSSKSALKKEFAENKITANFYGMASQKYLANYGDELTAAKKKSRVRSNEMEM